jgi:phosphatidylserine decarboxylase
MISFLSNNLLFTEGRVILILVLCITFLGFIFFKPLFYIALCFLAFCVYFFRNPERVCIEAEKDPSILLSPADGRVVDVQYDPHNGFEGYPYKVSIFLSVFNVHVNRMPISGTVSEIKYVPGSFVPAYVPKSSHLNEHNDIVIVCNDGQTLVVRQIAGIIARRIRCWVKPGSFHNIGERYGMIMFGSRVDLLLPGTVELYITKDQSVVGGQTIIGRMKCK